MHLFKQNGKHLKRSFDNVKRDTSLLFEWVNYLYQRSQHLERLVHHQQNVLNSLHNWVSKNTLRVRDVKKIVDSSKSNNPLQHQIEILNRKLTVLASLYDRHNYHISDLHSKITLQNPVSHIRKKSALKEKVIKKISHNSKSYLRNTILSYINKHLDISALELKEIVVDEQGLCSKSSFYRILNELEKEDKVGIVKKGSQKIYLKKSISSD